MLAAPETGQSTVLVDNDCVGRHLNDCAGTHWLCLVDTELVGRHSSDCFGRH